MGRMPELGCGGITQAAQAAEQGFMALLLAIRGSIRDFLIPLMGLVKRGVLADGAINGSVICVVNYFTGRGEHSQGLVWQG